MGWVIRIFHRWLGLIAALFWILQASTGVLIVFRWEIDDATLAGARSSFDANSLATSIETVMRERGPVSSAWASSNAADRFDIYYTDLSGAERIRRVDAAGRNLRDRPASAVLVKGAIFDTLSEFHQSLLGGATGTWVIRISGLLLLTNLIMGLRLVWPRAGLWSRAMFFHPKGPRRIVLWHRLLGLWGVFPALLLVMAGLLLTYADDLERWLAVVRTDPAPISGPSNPLITAGTALSIALSRYPRATVSAIQMPTAAQRWYRVRLRRESDFRRNWGLTAVVVNASNGAVIDDTPAPLPNTRRGMLDLLYPFHTGQIAGWPGRVFVLCVGGWVITMITLGLVSWARRRRQQPQ